MKFKNSKAKGNRLEYEVAKFYNRKLDPKAKRMPTSGAMDNFKGDILKSTYDGWKDECKSRAKMSIYDFWEQTVRQAGYSEKPVLFIKANNKPILAVIRIEDYFDLREEILDWNNPDKKDWDTSQ